MNNALKGKVIDVLVENLTDDKSKAFGRSEYMTSVIFNGKKNDIGKIVQVRINNSNRNTLFGEVITNSDQKVAQNLSEITKKIIDQSLKFVYSDNNSLSVIFHDNNLLMGVVGEFNKNLQELEKITKCRLYSLSLIHI